MKWNEYFIILFILIPLLFFKFLGLDIIINLIFFIIILGIFIFILWLRNKNISRTLKEIKIINEKLKEKSNNIDEIFFNSENINKIWLDYKEKMFENKNHIDPEEYFNTSTLVNSTINLYWFSYIPNLFITIGIMGTFLGLSIGLKKLIVVDIFSISNENLSRIIRELLKNVSTSFYTSLYGMYYSVLFNIENTRFFSYYENEIEILNSELRKRFFYNLEIEKIEEIRKELVIQNTKINELDIKLKIQHNKTEEVIEEFKFQNVISQEIKEILKIEIEKSNELINKFTEQNIFIDKMLTNIKKMIKIFETELRSTLKLIFNDEYVTEMNKIQTDFLKNSKELYENYKVLKNENEKIVELINKMNFLIEKIYLFGESINNTINVIEKIKEQLFDISDKFYSKEQLEKMVTTLNHFIEVNNNNLSELSEKYRIFKDEMAISLSTFYQNFKKLDYHSLKDTIKQTLDISNRNKEMVEKYFTFYDELKYNNSVVIEEYKKMSSNLKNMYELDNITYAKNIDQLFKNKNTFDYLNETLKNEVEKYREYVGNINRFSEEFKNNVEIQNEINELTEKIDLIYEKIKNTKEYIDYEKNRTNKRKIIRKYNNLIRGKINDKKK